MTLRVVIADDEPLARQGLRDLLDDSPAVTLVAECGSGAETVGAVTRHRPDLLLLDIAMPDGDGFEVLRACPPPLPLVIFVTAFDAHAVRAFEVHAVDYLLKPVRPERFAAAVARARTALAAARATAGDRLEALLAAEAPGGRWTRRVMVSAGDRVAFLRVEEIDRVEAAGNYLRVHTRGERYLMRETLQSLAARLDPDDFLRVHRSHLVNLDRVRGVESAASGEQTVVLRDGTRLPLSRTFRRALDARLGRTL